MRAGDIGVVLAGGARSHQENYADAFRAAGCRLLAVGVAECLAPEEAARHAELARSLGLPLLALEGALRLPGAMVASVAVGMPHRAAVAAACANAGLHLYLDKPLAGSAAAAAAIRDAAMQAGVRAQVFSHVTAGWALRARAAVRDRRLGRVVAVHADMLMAKGQPAALAGSPRVESAAPSDFPEDIAKREMTDMGIYPVSLVCWLLGLRVLAANAVTANHFFAEHLSRGVEDYGAMLLRLEGGVTATVTCGRTGWRSHHGPYLSRVMVVGERGSLVAGTDQEMLRVTAPDGEPPATTPVDPMGMWLSTRQGPRPPVRTGYRALDPGGPGDVSAFVAALCGGEQLGIGADAAVHHCEVLAAAYRSAAEGREVAVVRAGPQSGSGPR